MRKSQKHTNPHSGLTKNFNKSHSNQRACAYCRKQEDTMTGMCTREKAQRVKVGVYLLLYTSLQSVDIE